MYGLLFRTAAAVIRRLCLDPKYLGAEPAMLGVLHTWTGRLGCHPHVHFLISAGGVTPDGKSWREPKGRYLIPAPRLSRAIAITNARLVSMDKTHVTFRYKDHDTGETRTCRLDGVEFLRRYLMHVLPRGFHKVRYYAALSGNCFRLGGQRHEVFGQIDDFSWERPRMGNR